MKFDRGLGVLQGIACTCAAISMFLVPAIAAAGSAFEGSAFEGGAFEGRAVKGAEAADNAEFRWSAAVQLPEIDEPALEAISLDGSIFVVTRPDLADLRLRNREGRPVAFVVRHVPATRPRTVVKSWESLERGAKPLPPSGLEVFFDPVDDQTVLVNGITIDTPLRDFEQQVRVFTSRDGKEWEPISPPTLIFDYSRFVDVRNMNVPINRPTSRHFRLVVDDVTSEQAAQLLELTRHFQGGEEIDRSERTSVERRPFRIDKIEFYRNQVEVEKTGVQTVSYPTTDFRVDQDPEHKQTLLEFNTRREPMTTVRLLTDRANFSRPASLEISVARRGDDAWQSVATGTLSRFSLRALKKSDLTLTCPEQHGNRYRIVVENGDSPPVPFSGVEVEGPEYQMVFLSEPGQSLTLDYGWPEAPAAHYDTAAIEAALAAGYRPTLVQLDPPGENPPPAKPSTWTWPAVLGDMRVVIGAIAILCLLLGWGLYRAARRIDSAPPA